jgi:hypothetical protein
MMTKRPRYPIPHHSPQVTPQFPCIICNSTIVAGIIQKIRPNSRSRRLETPALDVLPHYGLAEQKLPIFPAVSGPSESDFFDFRALVCGFERSHG